jgi:hypothetical protein
MEAIRTRPRALIARAGVEEAHEREGRREGCGEGLRHPAGVAYARLCERGQISRDVRALDRRPQRLLGRGGQAHPLVQALHQGQEHLVRSARRVDQMVRGRRHQRRLQLPRSPSRQAQRPGRHYLGRGRSQGRRAHHLSRAARRGMPPRQRAQGARRQEGRPRHHLSADDSGGGCRHARVRAHRRDPLGGVRRFLAGLARRSPRGRQIVGHRHRRRRRARRPQGAAQGERGRGRRQGRRGRDHDRGAAHQRRREHESGARRLLRRDGQVRVDRLPVRAHERRGSAVHPLHVGLDRQAQGRAAHDRRLPRVRGDDAPVRVRLSRRRHLLVHRRRRLGDRPQLHRVRPARQRRDHLDVRRRAELSVGVAVLGGGRQAQGQHLLH